MILVTSASGNAGRHIVRALVEQGHDVRATDLNPRVEELASLGVKDVMVADLNRLSDIRRILDGVDKVVFISPPFVASEYYIGKYVIDESVKAGIKQFIFHSVAHPCISALLHHDSKRRIEEHLMHRGSSDDLNFTILQPPSYMYNFFSGLDLKAEKYSSYYAVESRLSFVAPQDIAEVVAKIIREEKKHKEATYEVSSADYLSVNDLVSVYNEATGSSIYGEHVDVDLFLEIYNLQDVYARAGFTAMSELYSQYGLRSNSNVLEWLLGRPPTTFKQFVEQRARG
ncbi:MAG TPA: NmrA family NAD(P)-binding protein [Sphingobium sp.]|nr:NmrA family NAD(P)-binding protein [Sphingobium sp.]